MTGALLLGLWLAYGCYEVAAYLRQLAPVVTPSAEDGAS